MKFDAFAAGIEPGGLRNTKEIRILICYLLVSVDSPFRKEDIIDILQENGLANYFEITTALSDLIDKGSIVIKNGLCTPGESARVIANQLDATIPTAVRQRTLTAALQLLSRMKREEENAVEITHTNNGYQVNCHISGGDMELMSLSLYVPDLQQANLVKLNFQQDPDIIYRAMLAAVTKDQKMMAETLTEMGMKKQPKE
ncbi:MULTISPECIES: DUF4364 family protein [Clostridium]|uniref:DUF4364 family protein n=1 Tax=Clostridium TaxID=1485 RepID=UPI000A26AF9A|nr:MULTISPECIES: DUF4364 family protein [Clostridium]MDU7338237.1 DUF4364 family protein [Clostridium sp.]